MTPQKPRNYPVNTMPLIPFAEQPKSILLLDVHCIGKRTIELRNKISQMQSPHQREMPSFLR